MTLTKAKKYYEIMEHAETPEQKIEYLASAISLDEECLREVYEKYKHMSETIYYFSDNSLTDRMNFEFWDAIRRALKK